MAELRQRPQQRPSVSSITSLIRWLQLKNYQYEVTFSLYMLTSTEKIIFNSILLTLAALLFTAAYLYLPAHILIIYTRVWYYISGEFTHAASHSKSLSNLTDNLASTLKATKEILVSQTATSIVAQKTGSAAAKVAAESVLDEL